MATKRSVPGQKNSELASALTTYKDINSSLAMPCPPIHEFRSLNDALSAYISLSKILAAKVQEMLDVPLHIELQEKIDKLKNQLIDEVIFKQNLKCEKLMTENEFLNTQIPVLMEKLESFRLKALEMNQNTAGRNQSSKVEELEQELLMNKEKVRMNSQLTQALSESVRREQQLKEQCDNLIQSLNESVRESENLSKKLQTFENSSINAKKNSELLKIIENDLEKGGNKWKQLKYSRIEGLSDKENFELLRKIVDFRDLNLGSKEMMMAELASSQNSSDLRDALQERESDIKDLLRDYEKLQNSYKDLERNLQIREDELIALREKLAEKTNQLVNAYETSDLRQEDPEDMKIIRENYLLLLSQNQDLASQLSILKTSGKDFFLVLKDLDAEVIDRNTFLVRAEEAFKWRLALELQSLESNLVDSLKETLQISNLQNLQSKLSEKALEIQVNSLKALNEELKKTDNSAKNHKNDWKKFRREHLQRVEKIYDGQIAALKEQIFAFSRNLGSKDEKLGKMTEKLQTELKELTITLKKEHEGKKKLAELFTKEKETSEKTREMLEKLKEDHESLQKRYLDSKSALEDSNKKIFKLEHSLSKNSELESSVFEKEKNMKSQVEDLEAQKTKLYSEITRLNKKIQEYELEKQKLDYESKSNFYFTQENRESLFAEIQNREEKISALEKENFQLKNEIFELDVRLKSCEMDVEKMANMKKTISELQKQVLTVEMLGREKEYLHDENLSLREDLKNSQATVQQLKVELRNISTELVEIQSELAKSQITNTSAKQLQETQSSLKVQNESLQRERESLSNEMNQLLEEVSFLKKGKKALESENSALRSKIQNIHKDMPAEFEAVKEKVQELEMRYESLEATQDEMIVAIRKSYKNWCSSKKINPVRTSASDIAKEAVSVVEHLIHESKRPADSESSKEIIEKTQYLLGKIENQPDSTFKAHTLRLISENIELKQEMIEKHQKAVEDENIFQELKSIPGVNEWTLQKWKDSERDVTRLRKQLLEMTIELEKMIQNYQRPVKNEEIEYFQSETEFLKQRVIEMEEQILKLNNEKIENKQEFIKADKEKEQIRASLNEIYHSVTGKFPENDSISINTQIILECLDHLQSSSQVQERVLSDYESLRHREKLLDQRLHDMSTQENSGLVSALYEEKKLREELEEELTEKCNLIERILQEFEENKKNLKVREYEYQELLTLKDEEILKLKRELTGRMTRYS